MPSLAWGLAYLVHSVPTSFFGNLNASNPDDNTHAILKTFYDWFYGIGNRVCSFFSVMYEILDKHLGFA